MEWSSEDLICPNCHSGLPGVAPTIMGEVGSMTVARQSLTCSTCLVGLQREQGEEWCCDDGGWQPMSLEEAQGVRAEGHWQLDARWLEADLVVKRLAWQEIRTRLDRFANQNSEL